MASFLYFALFAVIAFQLHCDKFVYGVEYRIPVHKFVLKPGPAHALSQTTTSWDPVGKLTLASPSSYKAVWDAVTALQSRLDEPKYNGKIKLFLSSTNFVVIDGKNNNSNDTINLSEHSCISLLD
ncbi:hypothetical protein DdX_08378 [Ditylenchus destructor]|uniref:Uncharacterized protein n=1 Tax=Ditylenchus destructor TaxID=166010 RepID=A0AAD4N3W2_9BILA|nr:hypothetical protein DdX_08378 [Ditylenchus destructor]